MSMYFQVIWTRVLLINCMVIDLVRMHVNNASHLLTCTCMHTDMCMYILYTPVLFYLSSTCVFIPRICGRFFIHPVD